MSKKSGNEITDCERALEQAKYRYLRSHGWEYTSATPGCLLLWRKTTPKGEVLLVDTSTALSMQQHSSSRPHRFGRVGASRWLRSVHPRNVEPRARWGTDPAGCTSDLLDRCHAHARPAVRRLHGLSALRSSEGRPRVPRRPQVRRQGAHARRSLDGDGSGPEQGAPVSRLWDSDDVLGRGLGRDDTVRPAPQKRIAITTASPTPRGGTLTIKLGNRAITLDIEPGETAAEVAERVRRELQCVHGGRP